MTIEVIKNTIVEGSSKLTDFCEENKELCVVVSVALLAIMALGFLFKRCCCSSKKIEAKKVEVNIAREDAIYLIGLIAGSYAKQCNGDKDSAQSMAANGGGLKMDMEESQLFGQGIEDGLKNSLGTVKDFMAVQMISELKAFVKKGESLDEDQKEPLNKVVNTCLSVFSNIKAIKLLEKAVKANKFE